MKKKDCEVYTGKHNYIFDLSDRYVANCMCRAYV